MESYELLEKKLQEWSGMPYVVCCSSGTAALHLALEVLQLPPKSRVIVPDFTMVACPRAVTLAGLEPVFVDCDDGLLLHLGYIADLAKDYDVKAIMPVHVYGRHCMKHPSWVETCKKRGWYVIEDLAEAHGVRPHPQTDATCWSFYKNKIIAGEEGGAVGFRDGKLATRARQLRSLGFTDDHDFVHVPRGCNYRLSNANASCILPNFREVTWESWDYQNDGGCVRWENNVRRRREAESWYDELCPAEYKMPSRDVPWVYDLRVPGMPALRQTELVRALQAEGIAARHAFKPCHTQREYISCPLYGSGNAIVASREIIYLSLTPGTVTKESCRKAFEIVRRVVS